MPPRPAHPAPRQRLFTLQHGVFVASVMLLVGLAVSVALSLRSEYRAEVDRVLAAGEGTAQKLAFHTGEVFDRIAQTTLLVKYLNERDSTLDLPSMREGGMLADDVTRVVMLADARGYVIASTSPLVAMNIADEDDFKQHKQRAGAEIVIGRTAPNPLAGGWVIPVSRRIDDAKGRFAGTVTATVDPAALLAGSARGEAADTVLGVVGVDGVFRARGVNARISSGEKVDMTKMQGMARDIRGTHLPIRSPIDGIDRFVSTIEIERYPLWAVVAVDAERALADYRHTRGRIFAWSAAAALMIVAGAALLLHQVGRLQASREQTRRAEAAFRATLEGSMDCVAILQSMRDGRGRLLDMRIVDCNARAAALLGHSVDEMIGKPLCVLAPTMRDGGFLARFEDVIRTRQPVESEVRATEPQLVDRWLHHQVVPLEDGVALITRDVTERRQSERALAELAQLDTLTRLSNRRHFEQRLGEALARATRSRQPLALVYIDLDGFKTVNDTLGHDAGDAVLVEVAKRLLGCVRITDTVSRLGGDEFTVILEDAGSAHDVQALGARIVDALSLPHRLGKESLVCTPSIGAALLNDAETLDSLRHRADTAMYRAKRSGKARFVTAEQLQQEPELTA